MPCCDTGRNIQKYKGAAASTLQDVTDNGNTTTGDIITTSGFFIGDGSKLTNVPGVSGAAFTLQQTTNKGNVTTDTVEFQNSITSLTASGNVLVTGNVTASSFYGDGTTLDGVALKTDLTSNVGRIGVLESKTTAISYTNSTTIISSNLEINGNLSITGNTYTINSDTLVIEDRIIGIANNNTSHTLDVGIVMQHPDHNIAIIHHGSATENDPHEHVLTIGYTQNTVTDNHITDDTSNSITVEVLGNLIVQNNLTISEGSIYGDGTQLDGVALKTDLNDNSSRITNISTDLNDNSSRINTLEGEVQPVNRGGTNITSYGTGDILYASSSSVLSKLVPSTAGYFLQTNGTGKAPTWENVADIGSATPANLYTDDYITGGPWSGLTDANIRVLGNVSNLSNQLVARDDKGDIFVSNVNAIRIYGDGTTLNGVALSADLVSNVTRIGNLESNLAANVIRIGNLESNLEANSARITNLQNSTIISNSSGITNAFETGDLIYASGQNTLSNLSIGSTNEVLTVSGGGIPVWAAPSGGGGGGYWSQSGSSIYYNSGNVLVTGNVTASKFYGDGTTLTGVALSADLADNVTRIGNLESNLTNNSTRISILESNLADNVTRIGNLESNLVSNASRISTLENEIQPVTRGGTNITTYAIGDILIASATDTLSNLSLGTDGYVLTSNSTSGLPEWESPSNLGTQVAQLSNSSYILGGAYNGITPKTWSVKASSSNTSNYIVARDSSGDIFVSNVNAIQYYGDGGTLSNISGSQDLHDVITIDPYTNSPPYFGAGSYGAIYGSNTINASTISTTIGFYGPIKGSNTITTSGVYGPIYGSNTINASTISTATGFYGPIYGSNTINASSIVSDNAVGLNQLNASNINNGTLSNAYGGTGFTSYNQGDLLVGTGTGSKLKKLPRGSANYVLTVNNSGSDIEWVASSGSSLWSSGTGSDIYYNSGNVGIANTAPIHTLDVGSNVAIIDDGIDKLVIRGNVYSTHNIIASSFEGNGSGLTGVIASSITTEASRTISISTVNVLSAEWRRT